MKVVIFIPTLTAGGAERVASILASAWSGYPGVSVTLILMFEDEAFFPVDPRVKILNLGLQPNLPGLRRVAAVGRALLTFRKRVLAERPDFVLSFMNKYNVFCLAALLGAGVRTIVSERDSPTEPNRRLNWAFRRLLYPRASGVITQSRESERHLNATIRGLNIAVIYNPVPRTHPPAFGSREKFVLNVGRLVPKKGHADLLHAFAMLERPDWSLVLCGDGPLRDDLARIAAELGVKHRVRFMGTVKNVGAWCARAGVFAFPSHFEGFPNALAEAMVTGAPTVSYDCPTGPADLIVHGENGFLVPVGDIPALAASIRDLIDDAELAKRFSRAAARTAERLLPENICAEYFEFCRRPGAH